MPGWFASDVTLAHGGNTVRLRPSLRAAVQLERLHDGFATLLRKVAEIDTESVEPIITIAATVPGAAKAFLDAQCGWPLRESCHLAQGPLSGSRRVECLGLWQ